MPALCCSLLWLVRMLVLRFMLDASLVNGAAVFDIFPVQVSLSFSYSLLHTHVPISPLVSLSFSYSLWHTHVHSHILYPPLRITHLIHSISLHSAGTATERQDQWTVSKRNDMKNKKQRRWTVEKKKKTCPGICISMLYHRKRNHQYMHVRSYM